MDLHRRRSVLVRMTETGEHLETVRISNDPEYLRQVMARAGEAPEVVLEATYGWYWAADTLAELGAHVHLAHPLGVKMFSLRRVKNDQRDAADLADLLRMGRLPEAWIAPPATRELRGWVRHRAKLVGLRVEPEVPGPRRARRRRGAGADERPVRRRAGSSCSATGRGLAVESRSRVDSLLRLITALDFEIDTFARLVAGRLRTDPGYRAIQQIPGVGPVLGRGVRRRDRRHHPLPPTRSSWPRWAGLTPKHHESDTTVHRGRITKQGCRLVRWAAVEAVQRVPGAHPPRADPRPGRRTPRPQHRRRRRRPRADHAGVLRPARPPHPLPARPPAQPAAA